MKLHKLRPMSQLVRHSKDPSLLQAHEPRQTASLLQPLTSEGDVFIWKGMLNNILYWYKQNIKKNCSTPMYTRQQYMVNCLRYRHASVTTKDFVYRYITKALNMFQIPPYVSQYYQFFHIPYFSKMSRSAPPKTILNVCKSTYFQHDNLHTFTLYM